MISVSKKIPTSSDVDDKWIEWYKSMKADFGKKKAKEAFSVIWAYRGTKIANTNKLRDYFETQGINIEPEGVIAHITEFGDGILDKVCSVLHVGKTTIYIIGGVLLVSIAALALQISLMPFKTLREIGGAAKDVGGAAKNIKGY